MSRVMSLVCTIQLATQPVIGLRAAQRKRSRRFVFEVSDGDNGTPTPGYFAGKSTSSSHPTCDAFHMTIFPVGLPVCADFGFVTSDSPRGVSTVHTAGANACRSPSSATPLAVSPSRFAHPCRSSFEPGSSGTSATRNNWDQKRGPASLRRPHLPQWK